MKTLIEELPMIDLVIFSLLRYSDLYITNMCELKSYTVRYSHWAANNSDVFDILTYLVLSHKTI
jgi:hypothetical protein